MWKPNDPLLDRVSLEEVISFIKGLPRFDGIQKKFKSRLNLEEIKEAIRNLPRIPKVKKERSLRIPKPRSSRIQKPIEEIKIPDAVSRWADLNNQKYILSNKD